MSAVVRVPAGKVGALLRKRGAEAKKESKLGLYVAGARARADLVGRTPVDQGHMKNAWSLKKTGKGATVFNDAPHAGVIEAGARPHQVSFEGQIAIRHWAERKLNVSADELDRVVYLICQKIANKGQEGKWFVRDRIDQYKTWAADEVLRRIHAVHSAPVGSGGNP